MAYRFAGHKDLLVQTIPAHGCLLVGPGLYSGSSSTVPDTGLQANSGRPTQYFKKYAANGHRAAPSKQRKANTIFKKTWGTNGHRVAPSRQRKANAIFRKNLMEQVTRDRTRHGLRQVDNGGPKQYLKKLLEPMTQVEQTCESSDTGLHHADSDNNKL